MKVLLTGGTGFLGSHIAERLTQEGHEVRALVRQSSKTDFLRSLNVSLVTASLESGEGLSEAVKGIDAVVHSAGLVKAKTRQEFFDVNQGGTRHLLDAVKKECPSLHRFVHISSLAAFGFGEDGPKPVTETPSPLTTYGESKLAGESEVLAEQEHLPVTVIRPPAIYGPRDVEMFKFFQMISKRFVAFIGSDQNRLSLVYGPDCADAVFLALTKPHPSGRVYFVDDGQVYTQKEFAEQVAQAFGVKLFRVKLPMGLVQVAAWSSEMFGKVTAKAVMFNRDKLRELKHPWLVCPSSPIRDELGWSPKTKLAEGARLSIDWYREHGWL